MDNREDKNVGKAEALNQINDIATELKQATFGMMLRTSDGVIPEGYANLENAIGVFLAKLILAGKKFNLDENSVGAVVKEYLNAIPANAPATAAYTMDTVVTPNKRAAAEGLLEKWAALGVDAPDFITSPSLSDHVLTFVWRALRAPERRSHFTIELEVWKDRFTIRTHAPGKQFTSGVTSTSFEIEKIYGRDFFEAQGLCAKALHASNFNPLRSFNI